MSDSSSSVVGALGMEFRVRLMLTEKVSAGVGAMVGSGVGSADVGATDGTGVAVGVVEGWIDGAPVREGPGVGSAVGTSVGTGVGGLVYSTTIVDVVTVELAVAFLVAVMLTPVILALAATSAADKLPLVAADEMSDVNIALRLAALPLYSVVPSRLPSTLSSCVRATAPPRRTSSVKCTSISFAEPDDDDPAAAFLLFAVAFSARTNVTCFVSEIADRTRTSAFFMAPAMSLRNLVKPLTRIDDSMETRR